LFIKALGAALGIAFVGMFLVARAPLNAAEILLVYGLPLFPGYLWLWPMLRILPAEDAGALITPAAIIGWLVYIGISRAAVMTTSRRIWKYLFVLFLLLLCVNVMGCWYGARTIHGGPGP
jgi:hypothetical protein